MAEKKSQKTWLSPVIAGAFLVVSVTGILLFFHVKSGIVMELHKWVGFLFIGFGIWHLILHLKTFWSYLSKRPAVVSLCLLSAASVIIAFAAENRDISRHKRYANANQYGEISSDSEGQVDGR